MAASVLMTLKHPNIVKCLEVYPTERGDLCVLMDLGSGTLEMAIKKRVGEPFPEDIILRWVRQIADALRLLHSNNIVHRDIRPANIAMTKEGEIMIGEFGIDRNVLDVKSYKKTEALHYMAPEILRGNDHSSKSDVWALGSILLQLMTLKLPFAGGPQSIME